MLERLWRPAVLALAGIVLVVVGLRIDPSAAECGSREMTPGQICDIVGKGGPVRKTYDDIVGERQLWRTGLQVGGAILVVGAGVWLVLALRDGRRSGTPGAAPTRTRGAAGPAGGRPAQPPVDHWAGQHATGQPGGPQQPAGPRPSAQAPARPAPGAWQHANGASTVPRRRASAPAPAPRNGGPASQDTPPRAPHQPRRWEPQRPGPYPGGPPQPRG